MVEDKGEYLPQDLEQANINDLCRVRLTQAGREQYEEYYRKLNKFPEKES